MKKAINFIFGTVFLLCIFVGCIEPLNIDGDSSLELLVVEGFISTEEKTHQISISRTANYGSIFEIGGIIQGVEGATLLIRDDLGETIILSEIGDGLYETPSNFSAKVGRAYSLLIELPNGTRYSSLPELIKSPVPIDSVTYAFSEVPISDESVSTGFEVSVHFEDAEGKNFYLWDTEGLYELSANPELHELPPPPDSPSPQNIPDPKTCCRTCYRTEQFDELEISSDNLFDQSKSVRPVIFIKDDGLRFVNEKYMAKVTQYSVSPGAYEFYSLLETQLGISGDIFDSPPASIRGNIINLDDPGEQVVGYFWAASASTDSVFIESSERLTVQRQVIVKDDCRELSGTTTEKPSFW